MATRRGRHAPAHQVIDAALQQEGDHQRREKGGEHLAEEYDHQDGHDYQQTQKNGFLIPQIAVDPVTQNLDHKVAEFPDGARSPDRYRCTTTGNPRLRSVNDGTNGYHREPRAWQTVENRALILPPLSIVQEHAPSSAKRPESSTRHC